MDASKSFYFIAASWVLCVISWIAMVCALFVMHLPMSVLATVMVAIALILPLPMFLMMLRIQDDEKEWTLHTLGTFLMVAFIAIGMTFWIGDAYDASVKADFLKVSDYALVFAVVWLLYAVVNLVFFTLATNGKASRPVSPKGSFSDEIVGILADIQAIDESQPGNLPPGAR